MKFSRQALNFLFSLRCFRKKGHHGNITDPLLLNDTQSVVALRGGGCSDSSDEDDYSFDRLQEECKAEQHAKQLRNAIIAEKQDEDADSDDKEDIAGISDLLDRKAARRPDTANSSGTAKSTGSLASRAAAAACLLSCSKSKKRDAQRPSTAEVKKESNAANVDTKKARQATGPRVSDDDDDEKETAEMILAQLLCIDGCVDSDDENESDENVPIIVNSDSDDDFDPTRATLPQPSPAQQKRLHRAYEKKLRAAGAIYFEHEGVSREPLIDDLLVCFDYCKLKRGELMVLAQGKCPVPEGKRGGINFEGDTAPDDDDVFFNNASIRGARCIANALPPNASDGSRQVFHYNKNNRLRVKGFNYRALCKSSTNTKGQEHCDKHNAIEKKVAVMIAIATIEYLTAMGCFVMYLNFGGTAVKGLMEDVKRQLSETQRRHVLVVESGTHMYRLSYCIGSPVEQAESVTRYMRNLSNLVWNFMVLVVNPVRANEDMNAISVGDSLLQRLFDDENAVCVADLGNQESSSYANLVEKSHEQAVARGRAGAQALVDKYGPDAYRILGSMGGKMSMAAGAARNKQTVSEYASGLGRKGGKKSMAAGAARNDQTVSEYASGLGKKSMAAGAAGNDQTVSEYASGLGRKGGKKSMAAGAARNDQTVSEYASDLGRMGGNLGGSISALKQGLAAMNIDVDSCIMTLGKGGGFNKLEQLETQCRALGLDVEKVRSQWGTEMNKRRMEKYTDAEISEQRTKSGKKGIAAVFAMVESSGKSIAAHMSEIATGNGDAVSAGRLVIYKKKLVDDDGGALYHFKCISCRSDLYVADKGKGNKWDDPNEKKKNSNRESCRKCKNRGELPLPSSKSGKSGQWAFQCEVDEEARAQLHEEWRRDITDYEESQRKKRNANTQKSKKKKKEKMQQNNK